MPLGGNCDNNLVTWAGRNNASDSCSKPVTHQLLIIEPGSPIKDYYLCQSHFLERSREWNAFRMQSQR